MENQSTKDQFKKILFKRIETDRVLNEDNLLKFSLMIAGCALIFDLFLSYFAMIGSPLAEKNLMTPVIQTITYQTAKTFEVTGLILQNVPKAFSLTEGPLLSTFIVTEYIGQSINQTISQIISFTQTSLNTTVATSLAASN
jgi:hypothetical protein